MLASLGAFFFCIAFPVGTALDVPDEAAMMQVQLKSDQGRSRAASVAASKGLAYATSLNHTNASGPGCNVGIRKLPGESGTKSLAQLGEEALNATAAEGGVLQGVVRGGDITMVTVKGTTCNCTTSLGTNPLIDYCEPDGVFGVDENITDIDMPTDFVPWNLDRIDARRGFDNSYNVNEGLTTTIYTVDSGLLFTHIDASGRAIPGIETEAGNLILCRPVNKTCSKDTWGHGAHVGGITAGNSAGVSKLSRMVGVRISGIDKANAMSAWMRGLNWVSKYASKPATIASVWTMNTRSTALTRVCNTLVNSGLVMAVAAGNKLQSACQQEPGNAGNVMVQASADRWDRRSWWSAFGMCVSLFCPGESISSWGYHADDEFTEMSGTSMATPHSAAASGIIVSRAPTLTPADVQMILVGDSTKGVLTNIGAGSPNILLYVATDAGKCFPGESTVQVEHVGRMSMMNLQLGDRVRVNSAAGEMSYEPVLGFLHLVHGVLHQSSEFLNVIHSNGQFRATSGHLVLTISGDMPTSHLQVGDPIADDGTAGLSKVIAIYQAKSASGMYAPFTASGTAFVDDVVASNYAAPSNGLHLPHTSAHAFFYPLRVFCQFGFTSGADENNDTVQPFLSFSHQLLRLDKAFVRWASY